MEAVFTKPVLFLVNKNGNVGLHKYKRNLIFANGAIGFKKLLLAVFKAWAVNYNITCGSL
jgi:hypothetical protein